ncbi:mechanosensitive ion channel family protein [Cyanobium sp. CH-040]|uniref:mechanosensitive ion channel family protein n=1 Tax=Cyanobium sp. CH-040 TaxID=2823708 RepID=UPI0020CF5C19|nr:mechanosensitive ion channel domain-containing protein [Cyanobium sp. CH-040]MCP9928244.1 mechanosensitive ion channel [Cyanobium sp. CH-040]
MSELLSQIGGWFGYLSRPGVLVQLSGVAVLIAASLLASRRPPARPAGPWFARLGLLALLGLFTAVLAAVSMPYGLVGIAALLIGGWFGLGLLRHGLGRWLPAGEVRQLDSGLLRPLYLLFSLVMLIREVDAPASLAVIPIGTWFGSTVTVGQVFLSLLVIVLLFVGSRPPSHGLAWILQRLLGGGDSGRRALALLIQYSIIATGVVWTLDQIGFNRTAILAVAGGLSVGLGFGIKEVFSNFISGLWLLFEGSVRPGDILYIDGDPCEVRSLGLRAAVLWRDRDNAELVIPNQTFFTTTTTTFTGSDRMRISEVSFGAAYHHDPGEVIRLAAATAAEVPGVLAEPAPKVLVMGYGDSAINYALRFWIANPMQNLSISTAVRRAIWQAFQRQGIEIPFPQRVLHRGRSQPG